MGWSKFSNCWRLCLAPVISSLLAFMLAAHAFAATDFRARGNEPGWSVTISEAAIELRMMDGKMASVSPVPQPEKSGKTETYAGKADGKPFTLVITDALCVDNMSGMPHPKSVSVKWGELALTGCGGDPASLIQGDWIIESINGNAVSVQPKPTLSLDDKGGLAGGGICNRFFGSYELSGEGLTIGGVGSTQMACEQALMDEEALLLKSFGMVNRFSIATNGELTLIGEGTAIVARRK